MGRYVVEGKLHKDNSRIFIETERDEYDFPMGTWLDEVIDNITNGTKVTIVIDFERKAIKE